MSDITLGIIGGGQLGSLLSVAANKLNINTVIFSDDKNSPAKNFTKNFISGNYDDEKLIKEFLSKVNVITYEFENIPYKILRKLNEIKPVLPKPEINKLIQNRYTEKDFLNKNNIRTTRYSLIKDEDDIKINDGLIPGLKEISVIITRFGHQRYEIYEPIENLHEDQILKHSKIPAQISEKIKNQATNWATIIAEELDYVGTLCVEYFIDNKDNLYANEIAPRVHNSGHLTINSHNVSQFENHIRAVCGLEKVETKKIYNARMLNLIGNDIEDYRVKSFKDNEFFFDYQKTEIREKRKMGHFTIIEKEN